jgi:hypothetical protein
VNSLQLLWLLRFGAEVLPNEKPKITPVKVSMSLLRIYWSFA